MVRSFPANPHDPPGHFNPTQTMLMLNTAHNVKDAVSKYSSSHRDLHTSVSKVGKVVDRNFVSDYDSTTKEDLFKVSCLRFMKLVASIKS